MWSRLLLCTDLKWLFRRSESKGLLWWKWLTCGGFGVVSPAHSFSKQDRCSDSGPPLQRDQPGQSEFTPSSIIPIAPSPQPAAPSSCFACLFLFFFFLQQSFLFNSAHTFLFPYPLIDQYTSVLCHPYIKMAAYFHICNVDIFVIKILGIALVSDRFPKNALHIMLKKKISYI